MRLPSSFRQETAFGITKTRRVTYRKQYVGVLRPREGVPCSGRDRGSLGAVGVESGGGAVCGRREESRAAERTGRVAARPA
ncbi:unnamed protein product, partial [Musa hybrid cultivar]